MTFLRYFFYVLGAAILASIVGGVFAAVLALISPEFVKSLFSLHDGTSIPRYAAAVGAIWGVFLGTGVMGFCLGLVTLVQIARLFTRKGGNDDKNVA